MDTQIQLSDIPDRLLDAPEVAALLNVPVSWVREHTRTGCLPHVELGKYKRYRWPQILAWLTEQEAGGARWARHTPQMPLVV